MESSVDKNLYQYDNTCGSLPPERTWQNATSSSLPPSFYIHPATKSVPTFHKGRKKNGRTE